MDLERRLEITSVIGAAGKMGSGIVLLLAQEMARLSFLAENEGRVFRLNAIDLDPAGLAGLRTYIHTQAVKAAERMTPSLRQLFADRDDLVENGEMIEAFVNRVDSVVWPTTHLTAAAGSKLVFEAIVEKIPVKLAVLRQMNEICDDHTLYFTNTSSVPIQLLDEEAGLGGRLVGVHFYNPPAVQKLVEVIRAPGTTDEAVDVAMALGKRLRKKLIPSADVAGFIGNGHFIRDGLHALAEVDRLSVEHGFKQAVWMVNRVSQDWLVRPMGIFQLIDYVGIDVFRFIQNVMDAQLDEALQHPLVERLAGLGVLGGQLSSGAQKDGFFGYAKGRIASIYDVEAGEYVPITPDGWTGDCDAKLGALPDGHRGWKALARAGDKLEALQAHFAQVATAQTLGSHLARRYVGRSREIGQGLVDDGVAASPQDVNGVLTSGFFHLYGPINDYCV